MTHSSPDSVKWATVQRLNAQLESLSEASIHLTGEVEISQASSAALRSLKAKALFDLNVALAELDESAVEGYVSQDAYVRYNDKALIGVLINAIAKFSIAYSTPRQNAAHYTQAWHECEDAMVSAESWIAQSPYVDVSDAEIDELDRVHDETIDTLYEVAIKKDVI